MRGGNGWGLGDEWRLEGAHLALGRKKAILKNWKREAKKRDRENNPRFCTRLTSMMTTSSVGSISDASAVGCGTSGDGRKRGAGSARD